VPDLLDLCVRQFRHPEKQVGCRLFIFDDDVTVTLEAAVGPAHQEHGRIVPIVRVAVAHSAAEIRHQHLFCAARKTLRGGSDRWLAPCSPER